MIYSGLEIGQYFELERNTKCHNVLVAVTPATRMAFIFIQMCFIFLNEDVSYSFKKMRFIRFRLSRDHKIRFWLPLTQKYALAAQSSQKKERFGKTLSDRY